MSKAGFFLYTGDWVKDTRVICLEARGAWADSLCFLNEHRGSVTWPVSSFAQYWSVSTVLATKILDELSQTGVANVKYQNDNKAIATLSCRRMVRYYEKEEQLKAVRSAAGKKGMEKRWQTDNKNNSLLNPSLNLLISKEEDKSAKNVRRVKIPPNRIFPPEWKWLEAWVQRQNAGFPVDRFLDFAWWDAVSETCGGLSEAWLEIQASSWKRWIMDNPARAPTPKGYRTFVAGWLQRNYERERRFPNGPTKR